MSKSNKKIAIIIPAYNESSVIGDVILGLRNVFSKHNLAVDIIVVNDGSTDTTADVATANKAMVINHILNSGAGSATATGLRYTEKHDYDIVATMDADGQHAASDTLKGIKIMIDSPTIDLLIGSRLINSEGMSKVKILGNTGLSIATYLLFGIRSTDSQSGMRIFSKHALDNLYWKTSGYEFCSEMLWRASQLRLVVDEYPIQAIYTEYSSSKGQNNWNALNILKSLIRRRLVEMFE